MGDLPEGVDTAVGPSGADHNRLLAAEALERVLERGLDRGTMGLALPAVESASVIFDQEAIARHDFTAAGFPVPPGTRGGSRRSARRPCPRAARGPAGPPPRRRRWSAGRRARCRAPPDRARPPPRA